MKIYLRDKNPAMVDAWRRRFADVDARNEVDIALGSPLDIEGVAIVSPANSFGFMDGGIDAVYAKAFPGLAEEARDFVERYHGGEQPVGSTINFPFGGRVWIIAPTMRVPEDVSKTLNAYLAFRAIVNPRNEQHRYRNGPESFGIACPGLCTGYGQMPPEESARQMWHAYHRAAKGFDVSSLAENARHEAELRGMK